MGGMKNIEYNESGRFIRIVDQSLLPNEEKYIEIKEPAEMYEAIQKLRVRGAPAIGIFAGYCMALLARREAKPQGVVGCCGAANGSDDTFMQNMTAHGEYLKSSRPTAVNLAWAVDRVLHAARVEMHRARNADPTRINANAGADRLAKAVADEAFAIHEEDKAMCLAIARNGLEELKRIRELNGPDDAYGILTHCNAGPLATSEYGTALGPIILGNEQGVNFRVFADETRPLLQGARLTAYELDKAGVDVTLICDNMASMVMSQGRIEACFVGCDRVAANGDTANKIGTSGVAVLAKHYGVPFYVLGPSSTIDSACPTGADIPIEERNPDEIKTMFYEKSMAPEHVKCFNPAFDVTDHSLITAIITERGVFRPPFSF